MIMFQFSAAAPAPPGGQQQCWGGGWVPGVWAEARGAGGPPPPPRPLPGLRSPSVQSLQEAAGSLPRLPGHQVTPASIPCNVILMSTVLPRSLAPSVCGWLLAHLRKRLLLIMEAGAGGGEAGPSVQGRRSVTGLTGS